MSIERLNTVWPEWKLVEKLGEGSFGKVYKVTREEHSVTSLAAVKVISIPQNEAELATIRSDGMDESGTRSYFEGIVTDFVNEIKLMESMKGTSNIVSVEDYKVLEKTDEIGWDIFIRMELLTPLNAHFANREVSETDVIKLGKDVCSALELCSQRNIIHRDIKPENIFVSSFGDFKVGDFGIARELEKTSGSLSQKGTYNYMAPEIPATKHYDATVDIYSLGIVLYKLLNNSRLPFLDPYAKQIQYQDRKDANDRRFSGEPLPAPVNASPHLAQIILAACAFQPTERFKTPTAFKNALGAVVGEKPSPIPAPVELNPTTPLWDATEPKQPTAESVEMNTTISMRGMQDTTQPDAELTTLQKASTIPDIKKPKSVFKKVLIGFTTLVFVAAVLAGLYFLNPGGVLDGIINDPASDVVAALVEGDYSVALELVEELDSDDLYGHMSERLNVLSAEFLAEEIEFAVATTELDTIGRMDIPELAGQLSETREYINDLNASRAAFNTAETFFEDGNYAQAIVQYGLVIQDDPNYEGARQGVGRATDAFREDALASARSYSSDNDYENAMRVLNDALLVIQDDAEITQELNLFMASHADANRQMALDTAADYADSENWANAISTLNNALRTMPDDSLIADRLRGYEQSFITSSMDSANSLVEEGRHDDAIVVLNEVSRSVPNNQQVQEEISRIEGLRPIGLANVVVVDSRHYEHFLDIFTDSFGNHHHESFLFNPRASGNDFSVADRTSYAVFNLNREYSTFSADLVAPAGLYSGAEFLIEIWLDDSTAPVTFAEGFNVRTEIQRIEANVEGALIMEISVRTRGGGGSWHAMRLVNAELSR